MYMRTFFSISEHDQDLTGVNSVGGKTTNPGNQPKKENTSTKRRKLPKQQEQSQPNQRQREKNQRNKGEDRDKQKNKREPKSVITHVKCFCQQVHDNVRG